MVVVVVPSRDGPSPLSYSSVASTTTLPSRRCCCRQSFPYWIAKYMHLHRNRYSRQLPNQEQMRVRLPKRTPVPPAICRAAVAMDLGTEQVLIRLTSSGYGATHKPRRGLRRPRLSVPVISNFAADPALSSTF
jgi:hypothetical protein